MWNRGFCLFGRGHPRIRFVWTEKNTRSSCEYNRWPCGIQAEHLQMLDVLQLAYCFHLEPTSDNVWSFTSKPLYAKGGTSVHTSLYTSRSVFSQLCRQRQSPYLKKRLYLFHMDIFIQSTIYITRAKVNSVVPTKIMCAYYPRVHAVHNKGEWRLWR
jgi:hypothetical protein